MKRVTPRVAILALGLMLALVTGIYAQVKKDAQTGLDRLTGTIQSIDKEKSTLTLIQSSGAKAPWKVTYSDKTTFTLLNKPGKVGDLKEGQRVIVLGTMENSVMKASRIEMLGEK